MEKITVPAKIESLNAVLEFIGGALSRTGVDGSKQNNFLTAAEEIFINIANYAYPSTEGNATVATGTDRGVFAVEFSDKGIPYDPLSKADPDISLSVEERELGGLGIFMVKRMMNEVLYRYENGRNILTIKKRIS